ALALTSSARGRRHGREIGPNLDEAWLAAAKEIAASRGGARLSGQLATSLGIDERRAEQPAALIHADAAASPAPQPFHTEAIDGAREAAAEEDAVAELDTASRHAEERR